MVANTLHAAAVLLREGGDWDWFINLSASDYPLVTQDGELPYLCLYLTLNIEFLFFLFPFNFLLICNGFVFARSVGCFFVFAEGSELY